MTLTSTSNGKDGDEVDLFHIQLFGSHEDVEKLLDEECKSTHIKQTTKKITN